MEDDKWIFLSADSAQAEARVIFLLAEDEWALEAIETHDFHALTASWFFGGTENDYSKKILGYESPIRFAGKTLRHAGHLGAGKKRAAISVNTDARKFKINISIDERTAEKALKIFHEKQPKIQQVFQKTVIDILQKSRRLYAPVPYGFDAPFGGVRTFFERWGEELFRQGFSYIPQRAVSDNTKGAGIRIKERLPEIKIVLEAHDGILFCLRESMLPRAAPIVKQEFERPIDFRTCSIVRRPMAIPCELETGYNYQDLKKFKMIESPVKEKIELAIDDKLVNDSITIGKDTYQDDKIYYHTVEKKNYPKFEME